MSKTQDLIDAKDWVGLSHHTLNEFMINPKSYRLNDEFFKDFLFVEPLFNTAIRGTQFDVYSVVDVLFQKDAPVLTTDAMKAMFSYAAGVDKKDRYASWVLTRNYFRINEKFCECYKDKKTRSEMLTVFKNTTQYKNYITIGPDYPFGQKETVEIISTFYRSVKEFLLIVVDIPHSAVYRDFLGNGVSHDTAIGFFNPYDTGLALAEEKLSVVIEYAKTIQNYPSGEHTKRKIGADKWFAVNHDVKLTDDEIRAWCSVTDYSFYMVDTLDEDTILRNVLNLGIGALASPKISFDVVARFHELMGTGGDTQLWGIKYPTLEDMKQYPQYFSPSKYIEGTYVTEDVWDYLNKTHGTYAKWLPRNADAEYTLTALSERDNLFTPKNIMYILDVSGTKPNDALRIMSKLRDRLPPKYATLGKLLRIMSQY